MLLVGDEMTSVRMEKIMEDVPSMATGDMLLL